MFTVLTLALLGCEPELPPGQCEDHELIESWVDADLDGFGDKGTRELVCQLRDGLVTNKDDCDDQRSQVYPDAPEQCDGIDNDCNGEVDDGLRELDYYQDADGDGYGNFERSVEGCAPPPGYVENFDDCNDLNAQVNPGATEICNGNTDDNCNGKADDLDPTTDFDTARDWYYDLDDDGYGGLEPLPFPEEALNRTGLTNPFRSCSRPVLPPQLEPFPGTYVGNLEDCDDTNALVSPDGIEVCNQIDDDCDNLIDDSDPDLEGEGVQTFYADDDRDGAGDASRPVEACFRPWFTSENADDCDDTNPFLQEPTGWWVDGDGDGFGTGPLSEDTCVAPSADHVLPSFGEDCDDASLDVYPGAPETCDGVDNDCDELVDVEDNDLDIYTTVEVFRDVDEDGFGDVEQLAYACEGIGLDGYVDNADDCDDTLFDVNPDADEICNALDDDCDGLVDTEDLDVDLSTAPLWYADFDQDSYGNPDLSTVSCEQPNFYVANDLDCDDGDPGAGPRVEWWEDGDGDGVGSGPVSPEQCEPPTPFSVPAIGDEDCNDSSPSIYPGAPDVCGDDFDSDCNGEDGGPAGCFPDTCAEADEFPPLTTGFHVFEVPLSNFVVDQPALGCAGSVTPNHDGVYPVEVAAGQALKVGVESDDDAYVAILTSCSDTTSCLVGSDALTTGVERADWLNTGNTNTVYALVGCDDADGCDDALLTVEVLDGYTWGANTCGDLGEPPLTSGAYMISGSLENYSNGFDIGAGSCTGWSSAGVDMFFDVTLEAGERIEVVYDTSGDSAIYLLQTCGDSDSCVDGDDSGDPETIDFTNSSGSAVDFTLGLDCYSSVTNCGDFTASILID